MKKCKSCQSEINDKATKCPNCQADQRGWFRRHPILTVILVLFVFVIIGSGSGGNKNASNTSNNQNSNQPPTKETSKPSPVAMKITAREIADDFDTNQVAAEAKWKDKLVEFSGKISNITDTGISFSNIASKQSSMTQISCRIQDKAQLLPLKNGGTVTVRGVVGSQTIGVIGLNDCEVVK